MDDGISVNTDTTRYKYFIRIYDQSFEQFKLENKSGIADSEEVFDIFEKTHSTLIPATYKKGCFKN